MSESADKYLEEYLSNKSPDKRLSGIGSQLYQLPKTRRDKVDPIFAYDCQKAENKSFDDYKRELEKSLANTRRYLASNRSLASLAECERLLAEARGNASAMLIIADIEKEQKKKELAKTQHRRGSIRSVSQASKDDAKKNAVRKQIAEEIAPLTLEVNRAIREAEKVELGVERRINAATDQVSYVSSTQAASSTATSIKSERSEEVQRLIQSSNDLLDGAVYTQRETELIGNDILTTMEQQRSQLHNASGYAEGTQALVVDSSNALQRM